MCRPAVIAIALAATVSAASCGGGSSASSTPTAPTGTSGGSVVTIIITGVHGNTSFSPNPASVPAGQMVIWKNNDIVTHHIMLDDNSMATADIAPGASSQALPLGAIDKAYHCAIHPSMVGSLNNAATPDPPKCTGYCG